MSNDWKEAQKNLEEFQEMMEELDLPEYSPFPPQRKENWQIPTQFGKDLVADRDEQVSRS